MHTYKRYIRKEYTEVNLLGKEGENNESSERKEVWKRDKNASKQF